MHLHKEARRFLVAEGQLQEIAGTIDYNVHLNSDAKAI